MKKQILEGITWLKSYYKLIILQDNPLENIGVLRFKRGN